MLSKKPTYDDLLGKIKQLENQLLEKDELFKADINEAKRIEANLKTIMNNSPDFIMQIDKNGMITYINKMLPSLKFEEVIGSEVFQWVPESNCKLVKKGLEEAFVYGRSFEYESEGPSPDASIHYYFVRINPVNMDGKIESAIYLVTDITERKKFELELKESKEKFRRIFDRAPVLISMNDFNDGTYLDVNSYALKFTGYNTEEIIGSRSDGIGWISKENRESLKQTLNEKGKIENIEMQFRTKSGDIVYGIVNGEKMIIDGNECLLTITTDITERKLTEQSFKENEKILNEAQRISKLGNYCFNINTSAIKWSKECYSIFEIDEQVKPEKIKSLISERIQVDDLFSLTETYHKAIKKEQAFIFEFKLVRSFIKHILLIAEPVKNDQNQLVGFNGTVQDITEWRKVEEALHQAEANYKRFMDESTLGIRILTKRGETVYVNKALLEMYGFSTIEEFHETPISKRYTPEELKRHLMRTRERKKGERLSSNYEIDIVRKDSQIRHLLVIRKEIIWDNTFHCQVIYQDITAKKQTQKELTHSYDLMRYIIEHNTSAVAVHDKDLRYIYVSQRYLDDYKIKEKDIIGKHHYDVFPDPPKKWKDAYLKALEGEVSSAEDDPFYKDNGTVEWTRWECRPWYEVSGTIGGFIIYTEVITERKRMEEALIKKNMELLSNEEEIRAANEELIVTSDILKDRNAELIIAKEKAEESDRLKNSFLQNMSHEVRTPLNAIVGFAALMSRPNLPEEKLELYSEIINSKSEQLIGIITDMIEIAQIHAYQLKANLTEFDLIKFISNIVLHFKKSAEEKNIELIVNNYIPYREYVIKSDIEKLLKIFTHIIGNAFKFTEQGKIEISSEIIEDKLQFTISDSGIGISEEMQEIIFEPFRQAETSMNRRFGGNGLGLPITKAYLDLLGGTISLKSKLNEGTTISFSIPAPLQEVREIQPPNEEARYIGNKILIVEDEYSNYLYLEILLEPFGFENLHAHDGMQAIEFCKKDNEIGLVLMDIKMPVMDGHTAAKYIKEFKPDLPIIAQTAFALPNEKEQFIDVFDDYVAKPINENELKEKLEKYIGKKIKKEIC